MSKQTPSTFRTRLQDGDKPAVTLGLDPTFAGASRTATLWLLRHQQAGGSPSVWIERIDDAPVFGAKPHIEHVAQLSGKRGT